MSIFDDVFDALLTNDPGARAALRQTRAIEDEVAAQRVEIAALRREVAALQRSLATLVEVLDADDAELGRDLRDRVVAAARADAATFREVEGVAAAGAPYRGAPPPPAAGEPERIFCDACGKPLAPDDPELSLGRRARVCIACFQRGG